MCCVHTKTRSEKRSNRDKFMRKMRDEDRELESRGMGMRQSIGAGSQNQGGREFLHAARM